MVRSSCHYIVESVEKPETVGQRGTLPHSAACYVYNAYFFLSEIPFDTLKHSFLSQADSRFYCWTVRTLQFLRAQRAWPTSQLIKNCGPRNQRRVHQFTKVSTRPLHILPLYGVVTRGVRLGVGVCNRVGLGWPIMLVTFREDVCEYAWKLQTEWDHTFVFGEQG